MHHSAPFKHSTTVGEEGTRRAISPHSRVPGTSEVQLPPPRNMTTTSHIPFNSGDSLHAGSRDGGRGRRRPHLAQGAPYSAAHYPVSPAVPTLLLATGETPVLVRAAGTLTLASNRHPQHYTIFPYTRAMVRTGEAPELRSRPLALPAASVKGEEADKHISRTAAGPFVSTTFHVGGGVRPTRERQDNPSATGSFERNTTVMADARLRRSSSPVARTELVAPQLLQPLSGSLRWRFLTAAALGHATPQLRTQPPVPSVEGHPSGAEAGLGVDNTAVHMETPRKTTLNADACRSERLLLPVKSCSNTQEPHGAALGNASRVANRLDGTGDAPPLRLPTEREEAVQWWARAGIPHPLHRSAVQEEVIPLPIATPMVIATAAPGPDTVTPPHCSTNPVETETLRTLFRFRDHQRKMRNQEESIYFEAQQAARERWVADTLQDFVPIPTEGGVPLTEEELPSAYVNLVSQEQAQLSSNGLTLRTSDRRDSHMTQLSESFPRQKTESEDLKTDPAVIGRASSAAPASILDMRPSEVSVLGLLSPRRCRAKAPPSYMKRLQTALNVPIPEEGGVQPPHPSALAMGPGRSPTPVPPLEDDGLELTASKALSQDGKEKLLHLIARLDEILDRAASVHHYEGEDRERLLKIGDTLVETAVQRIYPLRHPLADVMLSPLDIEHPEQHQQPQLQGCHRSPSRKIDKRTSSQPSATGHLNFVRLLPMDGAWQRHMREVNAQSEFVSKLKEPPGGIRLPSAAGCRPQSAVQYSDAREFLFSDELERRLQTPMSAEPGLQDLLRDHQEAVREMKMLQEVEERSREEVLEAYVPEDEA